MNNDLPEKFFENIAKQYCNRYVEKELLRKEVVKFGIFIDKALKNEGEIKVKTLDEEDNEK